MCTIKIYDMVNSMSYTDAGACLYDKILENKGKYGKIVLDLEGVSLLPSMFLNVSIGKYVETFGMDDLRSTISFAKITKQQAERIKDYLAKI